MLKIISWNIQQGGGSRYLKIIKAIEKEQAHIIVFSEFRNNTTGVKLLKAINKIGFVHHVYPDRTGSKNTVLLASKVPFLASWFPNCDPVYAHSIVKGDFDFFELYGCYLPHKKKHDLIPFLQNELEQSKKPSVIVGDLNIGINGVDQKGNSFWYQEELNALLSAGVEDAFRILHGDKKEYSWYSHQGNGYRYDHSYVQSILRSLVKECYYLHHYREEKYSDHSPMVLVLG